MKLLVIPGATAYGLLGDLCIYGVDLAFDQMQNFAGAGHVGLALKFLSRR
jgi:hypothetical protein